MYVYVGFDIGIYKKQASLRSPLGGLSPWTRRVAPGFAGGGLGDTKGSNLIEGKGLDDGRMMGLCLGWC